MVAVVVAAVMAAAPGPDVQAPREFQARTNAQHVALQSVAPELCYSGRRFGGKSWIGCLKAYIYARQYPGARVAICREERASMEGTTLLTLRSEIVPRGDWQRYWREGKSALLLPNGSEVHVFGLDKPGRALGARYGFIFVDQAEQLDRYQMEIINSCAMQVGMPWHQVFLAFNPEGPDHWAYQRYRPDDGDGVRLDANGKVFAEVVHVTPDDLVEYLSETSLERFDRMDGVTGQRLRLGKWVSFEGQVFDRWDPSIHLVERPAEWSKWGGYPPPEWTRYRGIDFGYEPDPFCCLWLAEGPERQMYVYRQVYHTRLNPLEQAEAVIKAEAEELEVLRAHGCEDEMLNIGASYSDHNRGERAMLADRGVPTSPADKDVRAGIETVREWIDPRFGGPRLHVIKGSLVERDVRLAELQRPTCLEDEFPRLRWRSTKEKSEVDRGRDMPVDRDNHALDALRYALHSLSVYGSVGVWV
jgi:phage terminase large subunit